MTPVIWGMLTGWLISMTGFMLGWTLCYWQIRLTLDR